MKFHDIDSYDFDALGPIRIERVDTLPASFTPATDTGRILYTEDTQLFYYGDDNSWVRFSTYDELYAHITATTAHGSNGTVVGLTTLTNAITAHNAQTVVHGSDGNVVGLNTLTAHTSASIAHGSNGAIVGLNTLNNYILTHSISETAHPLATVSAAGFMPRLSGSTYFLDGTGQWTTPQSLPVGAIIAVANTDVPTDYFECNGASLLINSYPTLYNKIGYRYGYELSGTAFYGTGADGNATIVNGETRVISRTMYYNDLTINSGGILQTSGNTIYVKGVLTNYGVIQSNWPTTAAGGGKGGKGGGYTISGVGTSVGGAGGEGGAGGGHSNIVYLLARTINNYGSIEARGGNGGNGGNGGAGTPVAGYGWSASAGGGGGGGGGNGGNGGNIYIYYETFRPEGRGSLLVNGGSGGSGGSGGPPGYPNGTEHGGPGYGTEGKSNGGDGGDSGSMSGLWVFTQPKAGADGGDGEDGTSGNVYPYYRPEAELTMTHFKLPDYRGYFLKGWSHSSGNDANAASRSDAGGGSWAGDNVGSKSNEISRAAGMTDIYVMFCIKYR